MSKAFRTNTFKKSANHLSISALRMPIGVHWFADSLLKEFVVKSSNLPVKGIMLLFESSKRSS